ncbi:nitrite reductase large subunit NirB [Gynuella sp.]|uniref:nitrite reductase large subunit NirB n=1 Tax=Gynuella sp. TaxID=2969146 RepID=UPI003D11DECD
MNNFGRKKLVVIGNGMVGHHLLETLADQQQLSSFDITVFAEEPRLAYDRVHLSSYFSGSTADDLSLGCLDQYQQWGITVQLNEQVTGIDTEAQEIISASGAVTHYDKLILATGSYPFTPPISGKNDTNSLVYRTIEDLERIKSAATDSRVGAVIGGGLLGLEAAKALRDLGLETHVVEFAPRLMAIQLDEDGGNLLKEKITALGVQVHTGKNTQSIGPGEQHKYRLNFADNSALETDLILFSAGIRPRDELARSCGLAVGERGGIVIDSNCLTSDPNIYAIGECALWNGRIFGLVAPGYKMAKVTVAHLTNQNDQFIGADMSTKLKLLGVDVGSIGDAHGHSDGCINYRYLDEAAQSYRRIVVSADKKRLLGAVLVGDNSRYDTLLQYALNGIELPAQPESLILPLAEGSAPTLGPGSLPDSATLCSCLNVTKGDIQAAIDAGAMSLTDVKNTTKASSGCGGCAALLKSVVDHELAQRGVEINKDLCEHFSYTRQDLYNLVRVENIHSFDELIHKHGNGLGCDICKPTVASILASCWNEHIQIPRHVHLQDTNDTFMANMQKNGTYSVVPRIAGGEITPAKLKVLAEVADKYQLYTKITGGQRIDLFGAQLHQLPLIWEELIAAGFETGHAYGKAVRTVKSCVGSTWCRYGQQDSVGKAIDIEHRYKGLRAPHKLKFAVSGCTRECAEAQSKDIGIIATENGWNLYVCGNGGMKPRHADLFATDLDDQTLIRYIDRILMFYIKTADRLQRTSTWLDNLEGGLSYLQKVVIDDSLGICQSLEQQIQDTIDTYQCEWKSTVENPELRKRFRTFVNDPGGDNRIVMIEERQQLRPA